MAKRKQTVISIITVISVLGVATGVMATVIALSINAGFRNTLQRNLLGATAHIMVLEKQPGEGIANWRELARKLAAQPHITQATPSLYTQVLIPGSRQPTGAVLKGIPEPRELKLPPALQHLKAGRLDNWNPVRGLPPIVIGAGLARDAGLALGDVVRVISPQGEITPFGPRLVEHQFRITGIFESGFYDLDSAWAFTSLKEVQRVLSVADVASAIELNVDDIYAANGIAKEISAAAGPKLAATSWMEMNRQILNALKMERVVTVVTVGLIQMVAALNILISLIMMVMEKHRDIAILMSMGARREQISLIFRLQGLLIGVAGTAIGLVLGYSISFLADHYRWLPLDEAVYSLSFVPFEPRLLDGVWIAGVAILVSLLATVYPARAASRITPVEALRYE
ncbi:MAG: ABC transporter permease [Bryobacterales bacterium]|nr:ABC transporter permease [Bryobacterales bacterium]